MGLRYFYKHFDKRNRKKAPQEHIWVFFSQILLKIHFGDLPTPQVACLKIQCHIYILMKKVIILRKTYVKMKFFAPPLKETKHNHASAANLLYTVLEQEIQNVANARSSYWRCSVEKVVPQNFAKFIEKTCARRNNFEFCEIFKTNFFTELRMTASEMQTMQKQNERNRLSLLSRAGCNENPRAQGKHLAIQLLQASA